MIVVIISFLIFFVVSHLSFHNKWFGSIKLVEWQKILVRIYHSIGKHDQPKHALLPKFVTWQRGPIFHLCSIHCKEFQYCGHNKSTLYWRMLHSPLPLNVIYMANQDLPNQLVVHVNGKIRHQNYTIFFFHWFPKNACKFWR